MILLQALERYELVDDIALKSSPCSAQVLQAMDDYYNEINSNVHRGVHHLSAQATTAYETARQKVQFPTIVCRFNWA
jgi:cysteine desulfurase/selenocysteine lyase